MNKTQKRVYDFINYLCSSCLLHDDNNHKLDNLPVLLTRQAIANKLCLSNKTVERALEYLITNKYIYRIEFGNNYIYNTKPININHDFLCRVRC